MALTDLSRAFADLSTHTKRLEEAKARKAELRLELDAVNASMNLPDVINAAKAAQDISARIEQLEASETVTKRTLTGIRRELEEKQLMLDAAILSLKAAIEK